MEARDRPTHDADENKGKERPLECRAAMEEFAVDRRRLEHRVGDQESHDQKGDGADLEETRKVVSRAEQQPDRQDSGNEAVARQRQRGLSARQREELSQRRFRNPAAGHDRNEHSDRPDHRRFDDLPFAEPIHVETDEESDRNGAGDREHAPGAACDDQLGADRGPQSHRL